MILQPASRKEVKRVAVGTLVCDVLLVAGLFLASQFDIGTFDLGKILISAAIGSCVAVLNFALMCLTVQSALGMTDQKKMKAKFQLSYNARMILQAGWTVIAFLVPGLHFIAGAAPVLFPKVTSSISRRRASSFPRTPRDLKPRNPRRSLRHLPMKICKQK